MYIRISTFVLAVLFFTPFQSCKSQSQRADISLKDLTFTSIFGQSNRDSLHMYCLLGTGFFRAPSSSNSDSLVDTWIKQHPNAKVIPVSTIGPVMTKHAESKMTYCWLVDNTDTINNYLIKNGCFPGGTMMRPEMRSEMSEKMKEISDGSEDVVVHIDTKSYDAFLEQIKANEAFARQNKLGIWSKEAAE